jgi:type I restriction-modification system DNA methylase subunit
MSSKAITSTERDSLNLILEDLHYLFNKEEIPQGELEEILQILKSDEVKSYLQSLRYGSKPEAALRESFIAGKSILLKYLFGEVIPEVRSNGFIDYLIKDEMGRGIALELKPFFEPVVKLDKGGKPILEKLKQWRLKPEEHKEQILKYIIEGEAEFVILTDLRDWFFYSKVLTTKEARPFCRIGFFDFVKEYDVIGNLRDYVERKEKESIRYELDKWFLDSLKTWVKLLSTVDFVVDERKKLELIIGLINKFIFVQTLDDYGVVEFNWIRKRWDHHEQMWYRKGKLIVMERFLNELDDWFESHYDTELFREKMLQFVTKESENMDKLYRNLTLILGLTYLQLPLGALKGIMQYNFRHIDEDVLGKAYETFLAEIRKEEGVYYTPKYVTQYIAEQTVGKAFEDSLSQIKSRLSKLEFATTEEPVRKFVSLKILDPACGSGSFLVKALRIILRSYKELIQLVEEHIKSYSNYKGSLDLPKESSEKLEALHRILEIIGPSNGRELIAKILVRHVHGVDLDKRAIEVAKVNIWLEAIKLAPKEFRYDQLPVSSSNVLPNLEMNLCNGDSLVGLPVDQTIEYLSANCQSELTRLDQLRGNYLQNPMEPRYVEEVQNVKQEIAKRLDEKFAGFLKNKGIPIKIIEQTKPFHWALGFWYAFFDGKGLALKEGLRGFNVVFGNPPYVENKRLDIVTKRYLQHCGTYWTAYKLFDYAVPFIEHGMQLLDYGGSFGYIVTNKFTVTDYGIRIREIIAKNNTIEMILDVSYLPVFKGTAIYPIILLLTHLPPTEEHQLVIAPKISSEENITQSKFEHIKTRQSSILKTPNLIFDISGNILLCDKIRSLDVASPREAGSIGYRVLKFTKWDELLDNVVDQEPQETHLRFVGCGNIEQYLVNWDSELRLASRSFKNSYLKKPRDVDENKWKLLEMPKILIREIGIKLTAAFDEKGEYGNLTGMYALYDFKSDYDPRFLLALLNSSVLDFYYKSLFGSAHMAGGYLNYHGSYMENLPIVRVRIERQRSVADLVRKLEKLKYFRQTTLKAWEEWCARLKNDELTLHKILSEDCNLTRSGNFGRTWTSKVSFYPREPEKPENVFANFRIFGDMERNLIAIYGLDERNNEERLYEMEFPSRELMLHVYFSLLQALSSRVQINSLSQLFAKTKIPIIRKVNKGTNELTLSIIAKIRSQLKDNANKVDLARVDNEIAYTEAEIDSLVFELYQMDKEEVKTILGWLKIPTAKQLKVLEFLEHSVRQ